MAIYRRFAKDRTLNCQRGRVLASVLVGEDTNGFATKIVTRIRCTDGLTVNLNQAPIREVLDYFLRTADPAAWAEFVTRIRPCIRAALAKRLLRSNHRAPHDLLQDLEQETHVKFIAHDYRALRTLRWAHDEAIYPFATVTAAHVAYDWMRKNRIDAEPLDENKETFPTRHNIDSEILRSQIDKCLFTLVDEPHFKRDRAVFWLYFRWGFHASQIAKLPSVDLPVKTVENILLRLRGVVKTVLDADPCRKD